MVGEVGVEHDFACGRESVVVGVCGAGSGVSLGEEVEGGLGAGEVAECLGAAGVERQVRAEGFLGCCAVGEGAVEVEGVGEVEVGFDVQGAGVVDVVGVHGDVAGVDCEVAVLGIGSRVGEGEVEACDGLRDEPVELGGSDLRGDGGNLGVDPSGCFGGQGGDGVDGRFGNSACPPRRHAPGVDLCPESGEAVAQLEGVADELLRRHRRGPEDRTELGDTELSDQWAPLAGDRLLVLAPTDGERGGRVDRLGWVEVGPLCGEGELSRRCGVFVDAG